MPTVCVLWLTRTPTDPRTGLRLALARAAVQERLVIVNGALASLERELRDQGVWAQTTIVQLSEFGRTLTPNARGTDHAWGGHVFVAGGGVRGGQVLGRYPSSFEEAANPHVLNKGRMVPTTPWEALWNAVGEHIGVSAEQLGGRVLPNAPNFGPGDLLTRAQLFE